MMRTLFLKADFVGWDVKVFVKFRGVTLNVSDSIRMSSSKWAKEEPKEEAPIDRWLILGVDRVSGPSSPVLGGIGDAVGDDSDMAGTAFCIQLQNCSIRADEKSVNTIILTMEWKAFS
jgi:hypothetical protein